MSKKGIKVKITPLIISLLFLSVGFFQQLETNEIVTERHDNGLKKLVLVFEGTGLDEVLVGKYGFYENGLKSFIELYENNQKHGEYIIWNENGIEITRTTKKELENEDITDINNQCKYLSSLNNIYINIKDG